MHNASRRKRTRKLTPSAALPSIVCPCVIIVGLPDERTDQYKSADWFLILDPTHHRGSTHFGLDLHCGFYLIF